MCNCVEEINKKLKEESTPTKSVKLETVFTLQATALSERPAMFCIIKKRKLYSEKIRKTRRIIQGAYCPFCGERYED